MLSKTTIVLSILALVSGQDEVRRLRFGGRFSGLFNRVFRGSSNCPPEGFDALKPFNFTSYISARWYAVKQMELSYQRLDSFYCVSADYILDDSSCFGCNNDPRVQVYNQARRNGVDGERVGLGYDRANPPSEDAPFRGIQKDPENNPAKITVGFFAALDPTPSYWVVAAGTYDDAINDRTPDPESDVYEWAIITGGSPTVETENGKCIPDVGALELYGMWLFARDGVPPAGVIEGVERYADSLGLDTSKWLPVEHEGCDN